MVSDDELNRIKNRLLKERLEEHKNKDDLLEALAFIREIRAMAIQRDWDPWVTRQAIVMALEMDTLAYLDKGFPQAQLDIFDETVKGTVKNLYAEFQNLGPP